MRLGIRSIPPSGVAPAPLRRARRDYVHVGSTVALATVISLATGGAALSCSSDEDGRQADPDDAGPEASTMTDGAAAFDAPPPPRDAAPFDAGPLPVVCASSPCATSLVTTQGANEHSDHGEGFCALLDDGTVACWGANAAGQLGRGDDAGSADSPTAARVAALSDVAQLDHTCALDRSGAVWCWGTGPFLRNDAGAATAERSPVKLALPPAKSVGVGINVACALVDDGLLCWGRNSYGQIAPFDSAPHAVLPPRWIAVPPGALIHDVVVGNAAFARRTDGVTLSWGANALLARVSSLDFDPEPQRIALDGITSMDVTADSACATAGGIGYCWGRAIAEPLFNRDLPEPIVTPEPIVQIATTRSLQTTGFGDVIVQPQRWCAVGASGDVYCWGYNASGQAGDGTLEHAFDAVKVHGLPERAAQVKTTPDATCALLTSGKVYCWGSNYYGQLGNGKIRVPSLAPQEVALP